VDLYPWTEIIILMTLKMSKIVEKYRKNLLALLKKVN